MQTDIINLETPELDGVEPSKAAQIKAVFEPMTRVLYEFEEQYRNVLRDAEAGITKGILFDARRLRLAIAKVRTDTDKLRVAQKAEYLRGCNAIDAVAKLLKWATTDKEKKLKEIEDHIETQRKKAHAALQIEREEKLKPYITDHSQLSGLADMPTDVWDIYLAGKEKECNDRLEAEKQAEVQRIEKEKAAAEERSRILAENERLKKEADEREAAARKERADRAAAEAKREAVLNQERQEREATARKERTERALAEAEREDVIKKENILREELAQKEREIYEQKIKLEREAKERVKAAVMNSKPLELAFPEQPTGKSKLETRAIAVLGSIQHVVKRSTGIAGYHLNGDVAIWDEFEFEQEIEEILEESGKT